jgi:peptide/nickel transport system permease protein
MRSVAGAHLGRFVLVLAVLVVLNFWLPRSLPGSPMAGDDEALAVLPAAAAAELRRIYGLDRPLSEQFWAYLRGLARGDLGRSLATHRPVAAMIAERLPWTLLLVGMAVLIGAVVGIALGTAAAWRPRGRLVRVLGPTVVFTGALPEFLIAMLAIIVFATWLGIFPAGGALTPFATAGGWSAVADIVWHAALPVAVLVVVLADAFFLLARNALVAVVGERYLTTARGKGLPERRVLWHAWRNALPPVLTLFGLRLAFVVTGAVVVERIFAYPGMGMLLFEAVARRDYPVLQGILLVVSVIVLSASTLLDLAAGVLDPRTREVRP